jgi:hydrogenase expression/formation protein HypC
MCVALPGKVIEVTGTVAVVDFNGNKVRAEAGLVEVKPGDYALVHAGLIIQVLDDREAKNMLDLFAELEEVSEDGKHHA